MTRAKQIELKIQQIEARLKEPISPATAQKLRAWKRECEEVLAEIASQKGGSHE